MIHYLVVLSDVLVVLCGLVVLARGHWGKFGLKFAGVAISTVFAMWLLVSEIIFGSILTCPESMSNASCLTFEVYHIACNVAFMTFHIATGRDAIRLKRGDRRAPLRQSKRMAA